ncbi:DUF5988 family protein [Actinomadura fibrosa]|uniref:DUF5988 family protein n=1 Tax=Actinomadura fibrosa TaxID=111802 RepID=A0ABW2XTH6_9ACTN|nr:DUF5988 family protein [Actinomadura fibrosa]
MNDPNGKASPLAAEDVVLVGGPVDLPEAARRTRARDGETVKILHRGGYEHFERDEQSGGPDPDAPRVFRWTMRTRIAE